jgi:hypothetical protein
MMCRKKCDGKCREMSRAMDKVLNIKTRGEDRMKSEFGK